MAYVSRTYLNEKWKNLKWDMEEVLLAREEDEIPEEDVLRCIGGIKDSMKAILTELAQVR